MKQIITSLVSISAALLLFVLISEYTPRCNGQVHHRFSGWRPGGKKRSDAAEVNSNKITIERPQLPICQTTEERQLVRTYFTFIFFSFVSNDVSNHQIHSCYPFAIIIYFPQKQNKICRGLEKQTKN